MLYKFNYVIYDGCSWSHRNGRAIGIAENEKELKEKYQGVDSGMDDTYIDHIVEIGESDVDCLLNDGYIDWREKGV